jgi:hypothetical protein
MSNLKSPNQVGTSTNTTTGSTTYPSYVSDAQQNLLMAGGALTSPFIQTPNYMVAGFTPDQEMGFDLARYNAGQAYTNFYSPTTQGQSPYVSGAALNTGAPSPAYTVVGPASLVNEGDLTTPDAEQLDAAGIRELFNPYQEDVVNTTTQQLQEANDRQLAQIRARQAAESAYGGNRGALQESEQNRNFGNTLATTVAGLNQTGWNNAAQLGMGNTQLRQQSALANAAAQNQADFYNAAAQNDFTKMQASLQQQQELARYSLQGQLDLQSAANQQQANLFNAQQAYTIGNQDWQRQMQALQALLGTGGTQQQVAQQALNVPFQALNTYRGVVPNVYDSSTTGSSSQPIYGANELQSILPFASLVGGLFSDKTMKKDKEKMGKDMHGLDQYAYRYKGESKNAPKRIGPMAQDVEKKYPGSTARVGGKMMIKGAARKMLGI